MSLFLFPCDQIAILLFFVNVDDLEYSLSDGDVNHVMVKLLMERI